MRSREALRSGWADLTGLALGPLGTGRALGASCSSGTLRTSRAPWNGEVQHMAGAPRDINHGCGRTRFSRIGVANSNGFRGSSRTGRPGCPGGTLWTSRALRTLAAVTTAATAAVRTRTIAGIFIHAAVMNMVYIHDNSIPFKEFHVLWSASTAFFNANHPMMKTGKPFPFADAGKADRLKKTYSPVSRIRERGCDGCNCHESIHSVIGSDSRSSAAAVRVDVYRRLRSFLQGNID